MHGIDGPQLGFHPFERVPHRRGICDIGGDGDDAPAVLFDPVSRAVQVVVGTRQQGDVGAFAGQRFGSGQTDPGCGARHQGDAVGHLGHLATLCERSQSIWLSRPRSRVQAGV